MDTQTCSGCAVFIQHYGLDEKKLFRLYCGHCTLSKGKRRRPDDKACGSFRPGTPDQDAFATREYLSKELLHYLLRLPLLPEIEEPLDVGTSPSGKKRRDTPGD